MINKPQILDGASCWLPWRLLGSVWRKHPKMCWAWITEVKLTKYNDFSNDSLNMDLIVQSLDWWLEVLQRCVFNLCSPPHLFPWPRCLNSEVRHRSPCFLVPSPPTATSHQTPATSLARTSSCFYLRDNCMGVWLGGEGEYSKHRQQRVIYKLLRLVAFRLQILFRNL